MNRARALAISVSLIVSAQVAQAQELSRYRTYVLDSSVDTVVTTIGARATKASTLHERPAKIQELQWRAPYVSPGSASADPVRDIAFSFVNDALYQVLVSYDRDRTAGLSDDASSSPLPLPMARQRSNHGKTQAGCRGGGRHSR